eukprot:TRINITY_DN3583_c0_g1_i1.p1 TRINITY_DN3583_c0_g1~~TRINITY_DN3583_c0_g1_i1.p1  ORF type:complete len:124 (+),score=19.60 TRINITY_DN3583_c0_g1_i1:46-372(+)
MLFVGLVVSSEISQSHQPFSNPPSATTENTLASPSKYSFSIPENPSATVSQNWDVRDGPSGDILVSSVTVTNNETTQFQNTFIFQIRGTMLLFILFLVAVIILLVWLI